MKHRDFQQLIGNLIEQRLTLIDRTTEQMNKILNFIKMITENLKVNNSVKSSTEYVNVDWNSNNLIEKTKEIENQFSKK